VAGAWSAADLPDLPALVTPFGDPTAFEGREWYPLARDKVRFVGEPVAVVAAPDRALAEDGAELIRAELYPLEVLLDPRAAAADDAPRLFDGQSNVVSDRTFGEPAGVTSSAAPVLVEASRR
jgi:CO/xanthine dehydrogenase Mo-binding subunit